MQLYIYIYIERERRGGKENYVHELMAKLSSFNSYILGNKNYAKAHC